ncbi:MAG: L,D-transpeptidase family protein [Planctomycetota bacterium]
MRKLLVLLTAAAVVGIVISRTRDEGSTGGEAAQAPEPTQSSLVAVTSVETSTEPEAAGAATRQLDRPPASADRARQAETPEVAAAAEPPPAPPEVVVLTVKAVAPGAASPRQEQPAPAVTPDAAPDEAVDEAVALLKAGRHVEARSALTALYLKSRGEMAVRLRDLLDYINEDLVFNPRCIEGATIHVVQAGETLSSIGKTHGVNWRMIARINSMQDDRIRVGQELKLLTGPVALVAYKSEFRMALLLNGLYVKEYAIGIGEEDKTPAGELTVGNMLVKPRWYRPGGGIVEYGEEGNPLGERWIGFENQPGAAGLGIHGTDDEGSIGTKCSNGCIRLRNEDVVEVYEFMQPGSRVLVKE